MKTHPHQGKNSVNNSIQANVQNYKTVANYNLLLQSAANYNLLLGYTPIAVVTSGKQQRSHPGLVEKSAREAEGTKLVANQVGCLECIACMSVGHPLVSGSLP